MAIVTLAGAARGAGLSLTALRSALAGYRRAVAAGMVQHALLTVIDYSLPSHVRRLWVLDLAHARVLAREFVAHGRTSGGDVASAFSNVPGSYASSLGTFVTENTYRGANGLSLRLDGLDPGLNDNALDRGIVMHGAWYVSRQMIAEYGRLGRSEGCPALSPAAAKRVIPMIADGSVLFAYYPATGRRRGSGA
ncbi:MAG: murein L,D-transpeptidase catalytic domain family protein [Gemmatimonadota bacterium]|nr:murein L,D-transpeptidase catalytic domain family protein [Gemmatimonadota bacterium]